MQPPGVSAWPVDIAYDDLPAWMRRTRRAVDWPLALVVALASALVAPWLMQPDLPWSLGLRSEAARALQMSDSFQAGIVYPRWAGDFNAGYGSPLWNYLPPLPHYLTGLHRFLAQTAPEFSVKVVLAAALIGLAIALFGFARRRWGTYAGLLAAVLGLFAPQTALVKPVLDGDLGAVLAATLATASLWALDRLLSAGRGLDLLLAAGACAGLWLAHSPLNLIFGAVVLAWILLQSLPGARPGAALRYGLLAYSLGFMLSAFYWLPAWNERPAVEWHPVQGTGLAENGHLTWQRVLAFPPLLDRAAANPAPTPSLGIAIWVAAALALLACAGAWRRRAGSAGTEPPGGTWQAGRDAIFFALAGALLLAIAVSPFGDHLAGVWDWPPFAPRDLVFPASLCWALVGATLGYWLETRRPRWQGAAGLLALSVGIAGAAMPFLPRPLAPESAQPVTLAALVHSDTGGLPPAGREPGWLLPRSVERIPITTPALIASYQAGAVDKVAREDLPVTTQVDVIEHTPQSERLVIRSAAPVDITLRTFMFPGWRARLDERPVSLRTTQDGLITLRVPEGQHELHLTFASTAGRTASWLLSALAAVLLVGLAVRQEHGAPPADESDDLPLQPGGGTAEWIVLGGILGIFAAALGLAHLAPDRFTLHSPPGVVIPADAPLPRAFQGGVDLLAYDRPRLDAPTQSVTLTLYWRGWRPDLPDYQVTLGLIDADSGTAYPLAQRRHPGLLPTSEWPRWPLVDTYVRDAYRLRIPDTVPPGRYRITLQMSRCSQLNPAPCEAGTPLFVQDGRGTSLGQSVMLPDEIMIGG